MICPKCMSYMLWHTDIRLTDWKRCPNCGFSKKVRNNMTVFCLWEINPFQSSILKGIYSKKELAQKDLEFIKSKLEINELPEYDDYGLVSGIDYQIYEIEMDKKDK